MAVDTDTFAELRDEFVTNVSAAIAELVAPHAPGFMGIEIDVQISYGDLTDLDIHLIGPSGPPVPADRIVPEDTIRVVNSWAYRTALLNNDPADGERTHLWALLPR